jgi:hypothetical protein
MPQLYPNPYVITFDPKTILTELFNSYNEHAETLSPEFPHNLVQAFRMDFPRMHYSYNGCVITDMTTYHDIIYDHHQLNCDFFLPNLYIILLLLSTQASFFNSFSIIHKIYANPDADVYVIQSRDYPKISLEVTPDKINLYIKKGYQTFDPNTGEIYTIYHTCMLINFEKGDDNWYPNVCMLYWLTEPKKNLSFHLQ